MLDTLCGKPGGPGGWETRGEVDPDDAVGPGGELGRCQIKPATARQLGYTGKNKALLGDGELNRTWAWVKLVACTTGMNPARPGKVYRKRRLPEDVLHCYNGGLLRGAKAGETFQQYLDRIRKDRYVIAAMAIYNAKKKLIAMKD